MSFYLISALAFIFILGSAVVIHEFGHFAVAKLLKIRVETSCSKPTVPLV